eukprot:TRINITY_DN49140_c0_g1_i1.p1 TRINITY_DN49140_c0_g1~~TRINITY_DN49140_c0_g1_i1.p1  ORF type:complete len:695 (-),score=90.98 TRINITY_DN49140_c0_g1_i1:172-2256(-)
MSINESGRGKLPACGFVVRATKGGGLPLAVERRAKGKQVTVISNVEGNPHALCSSLTITLGVGGTVHEKGPLRANVEVQGDQSARVTEVLTKLACVRGLAVSKETAGFAVERDNAFDALLGDAPVSGTRRKPRHSAVAVAVLAEPPADAACRQWHGFWPYCVGTCARADAICHGGRSSTSRHDIFGIWDDEEAPAPGARLSSHPTTAACLTLETLNSRLRVLGMLAEAGAAVQEWVDRLDQIAAASERRREAPIPSLCAPGGSASKTASSGATYTCEECGATFQMKRTFKMHLQHHRREGELCNEEPLRPFVSSWRGDALAKYDLEEPCAPTEAHWDLSEEEVDDGPRALGTHSLAAFIKPKTSRPQRGRPVKKSPPARAQPETCPCPVCGESVQSAFINDHIDTCLAAGAGFCGKEAPVSEAAGSQSRGDEETCGLSLPTELLEIFIDMDLSPEAVAHFWERYDELTCDDGLLPREAFLRSLEEALAMPEATVVAASPRNTVCSKSRDLDLATARDGSGHREGRWGREKRVGAGEPQMSQDSRNSNCGGCYVNKDKICNTSRDSASVNCTRRETSRGSEANPSNGCSEVTPSKGVAPASAPVVGDLATEAKRLSEWLGHALVPIFGADAAEGIAVGVEMVLSNEDDPEAAANATELLVAEIEGAADELIPSCDELLVEFHSRLAKLPLPSPSG